MQSRLTTGQKAGAGALTALGLIAIALVAQWEGLRTHAYRDVVGVPTICFGETRGVRIGDTKTEAECRDMLGNRLVEFEGQMRHCLKAPDAIPDKAYAAFLSFEYNVGPAAFCRSTLVRKLNAGDTRGACNELLRWTKAGGRTIPGLVRRRTAERKLCMEGLQ